MMCLSAVILENQLTATRLALSLLYISTSNTLCDKLDFSDVSEKLLNFDIYVLATFTTVGKYSGKFCVENHAMTLFWHSGS